jgi:hypothetical protein
MCSGAGAVYHVGWPRERGLVVFVPGVPDVLARCSRCRP